MALNSVIEITPDQLIDYLVYEAYPARLAIGAVYVEGPPGIGKSACIRTAASRIGEVHFGGKKQCELYDYRLSQRDAMEVRGMPYVKPHPTGDQRKMTGWTDSDIVPITDQPAIALYDEFPTAVPLTQIACLQLMDPACRRLGDAMLHPDTLVVAAGNGAQDRTVHHKLSTASKTRMVHLKMTTDVQKLMPDCIKYAVEHGYEPLIPAFWKFKSDALYKFDADSNTFPCLRTWEMMDKMLKTGANHSSLELVKYASVIGDGAAIEFHSFAKKYKTLPDINNIIKKPLTVKFPSDDPGVCYSLATTLALRADANTIQPFFQFMDRLDKEYQIVFVSMLCNRPVVNDNGNEWLPEDDAKVAGWIKENEKIFTGA